MKRMTAIIVSPPFLSHLRPLMRLGQAFAERGWSTAVACGRAFQKPIRPRGLGFIELLINRNANTGIAQATRQPSEEARRLWEFQRREQPDLYVVDQLSYGVTIALRALGLPFVSFCPAHPCSIPLADQLYGVPPAWPRVFADGPARDLEGLRRLRRLSAQVERRLTVHRGVQRAAAAIVPAAGARGQRVPLHLPAGGVVQLP